MRGVTVLMMLGGLLSASPAFGQHTPTLVSVSADQSWMVNPGQRGPGPIDHGTLLGVSVMWRTTPRIGLGVALSGHDIRPRNLDTGRFYEGRVVSWIGFDMAYFLARPRKLSLRRIEPFLAGGVGVLRGEQRYFLNRLGKTEVSRENGFPLFLGGGVLVFVTRHVALRSDLRYHLGGEEAIVRGSIGVGYLF